jgi:eukaryotic-like serine/threonine-protein kinase
MSNSMASFVHAIRTFHQGDLSSNELFERVDRMLADERTNPAQLLEALGDEQTRVQLPPDIYAELQRRIVYRHDTQPTISTDEARMQQSSRDRMTPRTGESTRSFEDKRADEPERIKGVGDTLNGRFVLEECIGFGGMGTVYKALDLRKLEASDRKPYIAIKVLNVQFRGHPKSLIALQREAKKAQTLAHPNIVTVYDFDRDGPMVYLTMEYLSGKPLSRALRAPDFKGMPYPEAMRIVAGIGRALSYAHERGFVHCDLKPANVFVTDGGDVKVIDFGIARVFQKPEQDMEATVFDPGSLGAMTPAYASPEMLEHREPDPRDDMYALACITYELLTGRHPFDRVPASQARSNALKPLRPKNLGHRQWRALRSALALEREARTPTVARFLQEMSGARPMAMYLAVAGAVVVLAAAVALAFGIYWKSHSEQASPAVTAPVAEAPPPPKAETPAPVAPKPAEPQPAVPPPKLTVASVAPVLASVPCSALLPSVQGDALKVQGYLPGSFGLARLQESLRAVPGVGSVNLEVQQIGDENCDAVNLFAPYWKTNQRAAVPIAIKGKADKSALKEGDALLVDVTTPAWESYVNVDYFVLDGSVIHMVPSQRAKENKAPPRYSATIGGLGNWVISPPFGSELIVLLATPEPVFGNLRPESESGTEYLRALDKRLRDMSAKHGQDKIAVDFIQISTRAR